jgi:hypothetical protein
MSARPRLLNKKSRDDFDVIRPRKPVPLAAFLLAKALKTHTRRHTRRLTELSETGREVAGLLPVYSTEGYPVYWGFEGYFGCQGGRLSDGAYPQVPRPIF